jgi:Protein of unknown function (DUF2846)
MYLKRAILLITVISITSCASGAKYHEMVSTLPALNTDTGRIYFYRIEPIPLLLKPSVMLNGEKVGNADPWGFFYVDRPAGSYVISIPGVDQKVSLALEGNQTRYVRLKLDQGVLYDEIIPELEEENEALKNIEYCNYSQGPGYCESECESAYADCIEPAEGELEWKKCENVKKTCDQKCSGSAS